MSRTLSTLSSLAKAGFGDLDVARSRLADLGWDPEVFAPSANPDGSLAAAHTLSEAHPKPFAALTKALRARDRLIVLTGVSSGLVDFLQRHPDQWDLFRTPLRTLPDASSWRAAFGEVIGDNTGPDAVVALRVAYRRHLCRLAIFDAEADAPLDVLPDVAACLADMAAAALEVALEIARVEHGLPANEVPLSIIGMGKAGARELNYLSDVDVIYVTDIPEGAESERVLAGATLLARDTSRHLMEFGAEPGLWEVDANLRPEGKNGALVRTLDSHLAYYQRWASDWEFQALLKARPLAGDTALGERYVAAVQPLVFAASTRPGFVEQVQRMRERVKQNIPRDQLEHQLKLGPGGLRDIEFTIQLLQLVHGASDDTIRQPDSLGALRALSAAGYVGRAEAEEFDTAYRTLRLLEHRIQLGAMVRSHVMPQAEPELRVLARRTGLADSAADLVALWRATKLLVRSLHEKLFYRPLLSAVAGLDAPQGALTNAQASLRLSAAGFSNPAGALHHLAALTHGVSRRAAIQTNLLPVMLQWLSEGTDPDGGLLAFRHLSDDLGEAYWFLRMLRDSSGAAQRLTQVLSTSGFVQKLFSRVPEGAAWLDDDDDDDLAPRSREALAQEVRATLKRHAADDNAAAKALRSFRRRELLRLALSSMVGVSDIRVTGRALSDLAAVYVQGLVTLALRKVEGIDFAIIGMGRLGGEELGFSSDLDVLYVYRDSGAGDEAGKRAEQVVKNIARLGEDVLFPLELDSGLRPEGRNGLAVRSLEAYSQYYQRWALGWEAQALLRAASFAGHEGLGSDFLAMAVPYRYPEIFSQDQAREIRRIKARVEAERLPQGADAARHLKLGRGSLSDVEWAIQLLQLTHGHEFPDTRTPSTLEALAALTAHELLEPEDAAQLEEAWVLASGVRTALALYGRSSTDVLPHDREGLEGAARLMGYPPLSASALEEQYLRVTRRARAVFERVFYAPTAT
jgi:glutamate-ammonia-ligase adenylyltransferase